jgi:hypothetical protein
MVADEGAEGRHGQVARTVTTDMAIYPLGRGKGSSGSDPAGDVPELYRPERESDGRAEYLSVVSAGHWH